MASRLVSIVKHQVSWLLVPLILLGCGTPDTVSSNNPEFPFQAASAPCTNCTLYSDALASATSVRFEPDAGYYDVTVSGTHTGWLTGPAGTDFALRLMRWDAPNSRWVAVKTANALGTSTEKLTYSGPAGRYRWRIWSLKGSGAYSFWFQKPGSTSSGGTTFRMVSAAGQHACAITTANVAYCWGHGGMGQLGTGAAVDWARIPERVLNPPWDTLSVAHSTTCALKAGKAFCWGSDNHVGALGQGTVLTNCASPYSSTPCSLVPLPVVGNHSFRWLTTGGNGDRLVNPPYSRFACGLDTSGQAWCWGSDGNGELGDGTQYPLANPTPIRGAVGVLWSRIWAGMDHSCGIDLNLLPYCWGAEIMGEIGDDVPPPTSVFTQYGAIPSPARVLGGLTFTQMDAGRLHSCGVTPAGKAYCWGSGLHGQLGTANLPECSSDPRYPHPCSPVPVPVATNLTFKSVTAGTYHSCGLTVAGEIWCWGIGINIGAGDPAGVSGGFLCYSPTRKLNTQCFPRPIKTNTTVLFNQVDAGMDFTCAVSTGGAVYCWGSDFYGLAQAGMAELSPKRINQPTS